MFKNNLQVFALLCVALTFVCQTSFAHEQDCERAFALLEDGRHPVELEKSMGRCLTSQNLSKQASAEMLPILAMAFERQGKFLEAAASLEKAIELSKEVDPYAHFQLSDVYAKNKQIQKALDTLEQLKKKIPLMEARRQDHFLKEIDKFRDKYEKMK